MSKTFKEVKCNAHYTTNVASELKLKEVIYEACMRRVEEPDSVSVLQLSCHADAEYLYLECGSE